MIWLLLAALAFAALAIALPPLLLARGGAAAADGASDLAVYRDQLAEVDKERERGLLTEAEADAARLEIKRRILALPKAEVRASTTATSRPLALAVGLGLSVFSAVIYLALGRPTLPGRPFDPAAVRAAADEDMKRAVDEVETMVARLAEKMKANPNDAKGWRMLGWSYLQMGRTAEGVATLKHAVELDPKNAALRSQLGEAVIRLAEGKVTDEALKIFDAALSIDAKDPRARFYRGMALMQGGKEREALEAWVQIIREGPADAEWMTGLREQARALALKLKLDPNTAVP
ncbi:MAG: c-type cytochrome biogenesis protein CcmI [Alphaproteobacteria bacterium]|nr:c-type cytochrome biogenesis protein CcmI [Alphaproteobacteria bacterium]